MSPWTTRAVGAPGSSLDAILSPAKFTQPISKAVAGETHRTNCSTEKHTDLQRAATRISTHCGPTYLLSRPFSPSRRLSCLSIPLHDLGVVRRPTRPPPSAPLCTSSGLLFFAHDPSATFFSPCIRPSTRRSCLRNATAVALRCRSIIRPVQSTHPLVRGDPSLPTYSSSSYSSPPSCSASRPCSTCIRPPPHHSKHPPPPRERRGPSRRRHPHPLRRMATQAATGPWSPWRPTL